VLMFPSWSMYVDCVMFVSGLLFGSYWNACVIEVMDLGAPF
jgi:hypothetical protein